jgi:hypothetical protein
VADRVLDQVGDRGGAEDGADPQPPRTRSAMARSSAGVVSGSARATSTSVRTIASGVRSSCEAPATKRRWLAKAASSRPSIWSNVSASSLSSSSGPWRLMRSCGLLPSSRLAVAVMAWSPRRIRPAANQPSPTETSVITARATPDWATIWFRAAVSSSRCAASTAASPSALMTRFLLPGAEPMNTIVLPGTVASSSGAGKGRVTLTTAPVGGQQRLEHPELLAGQVEEAAVPGRLPAGRVEPDVVALQYRRQGVAAAPGEGTDAGHQLAERNGLPR